jgi:hypothetical protein
MLVVCYGGTSASIFYPEDGGNRFIENVTIYQAV